MRYYSQFPGAIPQKGARSHALLTRPPLGPKPSLDLHVLSLPPAFVLSQDQTLKLKRPKAFLTFEPLHIAPDRSGDVSVSCASSSIGTEDHIKQ